MFDHLLELSHRDDSNTSNIGSGEAITQVELFETLFTHLIWSSEVIKKAIPIKLLTNLYEMNSRLNFVLHYTP